jgi:hypothetical protein
MVMFDLKLGTPEEQSDTVEAKFEPDITSLVTYLDGFKLKMRFKT